MERPACACAPCCVNVLVGYHAARRSQSRAEALEVAPKQVRRAGRPGQIDVLTTTVGQPGRRSRWQHRRRSHSRLGDKDVGCGSQHLRLCDQIPARNTPRDASRVRCATDRTHRARFHACAGIRVSWQLNEPPIAIGVCPRAALPDSRLRVSRLTDRGHRRSGGVSHADKHAPAGDQHRERELTGNGIHVASRAQRNELHSAELPLPGNAAGASHAFAGAGARGGVSPRLCTGPTRANRSESASCKGSDWSINLRSPR